MVWFCIDVPMYLMFWNRRGAALAVIGSSDSHTACCEWAVNHLGRSVQRPSCHLGVASVVDMLNKCSSGMIRPDGTLIHDDFLATCII